MFPLEGKHSLVPRLSPNTLCDPNTTEEPANKVAAFTTIQVLICYMHSMQHTAGNQNWWAGNEVNVDYLIHLKKFAGIQQLMRFQHT